MKIHTSAGDNDGMHERSGKNTEKQKLKKRKKNCVENTRGGAKCIAHEW